MATTEETLARLAEIPNVTVSDNAPLANYTRFALGGPARIFAETTDESSFMTALAVAQRSGMETMVIGGGTNLIVADAGYAGIVLRYTAASLARSGNCVRADAGAVLQDLVDFSNGHGLKGLETLAGIPGWVGAAVYGNAGAYGHSISERVASVRFFDGHAVRCLTAAECQFLYRESIFKRRKDRIIFSVDLAMESADAAELTRISADIVKVRNEKFPVTMKCAGSIFKNFLLRELPAAVAAQVPAQVVREGKVPAAYFLEQAGAKGLSRGDIHVASYHANLIYNGGAGTAGQLCELIGELKMRVRAQFGIELEEEVQYVGFAPALLAVHEGE